jgi:pilus assembly protein Flp/PilA
MSKKPRKRRGLLMLNKLKALVKDEQGQGMTEYGLVLGVIGVAVVGTLFLLREEIQEIFTDALTDVQSRDQAPAPAAP